MPNKIIKSVSDNCGIPEDEVESLWNDAKSKARESGHSGDYQYIMGIFKNLIGKECKKTMKWESKSKEIINLVEFLKDG